MKEIYFIYLKLKALMFPVYPTNKLFQAELLV
jgi:hypothetical protein